MQIKTILTLLLLKLCGTNMGHNETNFNQILYIRKKIAKVKEDKQGERLQEFPKSFVLSVTPRNRMLILFAF